MLLVFVFALWAKLPVLEAILRLDDIDIALRVLVNIRGCYIAKRTRLPLGNAYLVWADLEDVLHPPPVAEQQSGS